MVVALYHFVSSHTENRMSLSTFFVVNIVIAILLVLFLYIPALTLAVDKFGNATNGLLGFARNGQRVHHEVKLGRHAKSQRQRVEGQTIRVLSDDQTKIQHKTLPETYERAQMKEPARTWKNAIHSMPFSPHFLAT
jgi:hypothetical protein